MRRQLLFGISLTALLVASRADAQAQDYYGAQRRYTSRDVLAIFGKTQQKPAPRELLFDVGVNASARTTLKCGKLGLEFNLGSIARRVSQLPSQLASQATSLLYAMPMLTICYASPALCAELKNLNFQINERFKLLSDVCRSIDSTIAATSAEEMAAWDSKRRGFKECVRTRVDQGYDNDEANELCMQAEPVHSYMDIARGWVAKANITADQEIIKALLTNAGFMADSMGDARYKFLSSVLGELKLDANGQMLPLFPARPKSAKSVATTIQNMGVALACDTARLRIVARGVPNGPAGELKSVVSTATPGEVQYFEQALFDVVFDELHEDDALDVEILDPPDRALACNALGRSLGRGATEKVATNGHAEFALAMQNPATPESVRQMYESRSTLVFKALLKEAEAPPERAIRNVRDVIHDLAEHVRKTRRDTAAEISKGMQEEYEEFRITPCESEETCEP